MEGNVSVKSDPNKSSAEGEYLQIKVQDHDGGVTAFKIKKSTPMRKLKQAFCDRKGIKANSIRFFTNGQRIEDDSTAKQLELEDGDTVEVFKEQTGGMYTLL